ncbi:DUF4238 domain-containing protein [Cyclobacterium plantarum]|uniref:DUF4238 domain-containing protein n=1 Tax=Cyclobacterium plantarum TaxID=2716263 RepID=UPI003F718FBB
MKQPINQNQHKVPQVYLKQFGYLFGKQFKVSVLKIGEKFTQQKSIKSFLAENNIYDIDSEVPEIERLFEQLNCDIETEYLHIISDLENSGTLSDKSYAVLLQLIPNFIARSDSWRSMIYFLLDSDVKTNFLKIICAHRAESFEDLETKDFYRVMADNPANEIINRALLFFTEYLIRRVGYFEIVILKSQEGKPWFTTDNPVIVDNRTKKFEIMTMDSELYFPINPKYLAYLHFKEANDKENELRALETNKIHTVTDQQNWDLQQLIMRNAHNYLIIEGELKYRIGEKEEE